MISDATARALSIIKERNVSAPSQFGRLMWPDSPAWSRLLTVGRRANAVQRGGGMNRASGGYLGKLRQRGLVLWHVSGEIRRLYLTAAGETALAEWQNVNRGE